MSRKTKLTAFSVLMVLLTAALIFGAGSGRKATLHFSHPQHVEEMGMACEDCHSGVMEQAEAADRNMPGHDNCEMCHTVDEDCGMCHVDPGEPMAWPQVKGMYEGFAHADHGELDCAACHGGADTEPAIPDMRGCQSCHMDQAGPLECGECHEGEEPVPHDHELASWNIDHGLEAAMHGGECAMCHEQESCDECHQGENLYGTPHPIDWEFNHGIEANWSGECMSCHETRSECIECHRGMLPVPHPFGLEYANLQDGGDHVEEASAFIEACLACHDVSGMDPTCARCHQ
jgi:hypothetical protein